MEPVRLAIIGAGLIGARHARLMQEEAACRLIALADPAPAAAELAAELDLPCYADFEDMLRDQKPDGVVVATPNQLHLSAGIACASHGAHMLMEKPVADSLEAGHKLIDAVKKSGVRMTVGHHRRFDPAAKAAREMLGAGEIGALQAVSATWVVRKHDTYYEAAWRRTQGGGPVLINLIHDIDMLRYLCGEVASVYAELSNNVRGFEVEDTAAIIIRFTNGVLATVTVSDAAPSPWGWELATGENPLMPMTGRNCYQFMGTEGSFGFPQIELWRHAEAGTSDWNHPIFPEKREVSHRQCLVDQLAHFCRMIRGDESPCVSGEDGLATLAATEAVLRSAESGSAVAPAYSMDQRLNF